MNKTFLKYMAICLAFTLLGGCKDGESDLLEPKVYFENNESVIEVTDATQLTLELQARVSSKCSSQIELSYEVADPSFVEAYNNRYGTAYEVFDASNAALESTSAVLPGGQVYTENVALKLNNLDNLEEGKPYLLPIRIASASLPVIQSRDIIYYVVTKPVRIMKAARIYNNAIKVPLAAGTIFKSITYEALIYVDWFGSNNTVMGCEGKLILRIGDVPLVDRNQLQIAGSKEFKVSQGLEQKKWYHVAFSYDQPSGKAAIYINGDKASEATWDTPEFDLTTAAGGFFIGKVAGFMWGERPFYGRMSEVRLWNVSRTENQIKQNMINVDPKSEGLAAYYKLNGTDQYQDGSTWKVKDASGHDLDGQIVGGGSLGIVDLEGPLTVK